MLQLKLSGIKHIESFARNDSNIISLSQGGLKVGGIPAHVKEEIKKILNREELDYYASPEGILPLREKIARQLSTKYTTPLSTQNIIITHGCSGALSTIMLTLLEHGDEVIIPQPNYPAYKNLALLAKAQPVFVPGFDDDISNYISLDHIKKATTTKTKMIVLSNPCNPTGALVNKQKLVELISWCEKKGIYLVTDEVYDDYIFDGKFNSITPHITSSRFLVRVASFSKNLSMSGWRIGYMVIPEHLFTALNAAHDSLFVCPSVIGQYVALFALKDRSIIENFHMYVRSNRDFVCKALAPLAEKNTISFSQPSAGFYLFVKTQEKDTTQRCMDILQKAQVATVPGISFGLNGGSYIRLCYARRHDILEEGIRRFVSYWENGYV